MPGWWRDRTSTAAAVAVLGLVAAPAAAAATAAGTWGAGQYRYLDGRVCRSGLTTSPLAAWSVSGGHRAYLTRSVTSNGRIDSAAPPVSAAGTPSPAVEVGPGGEFGTEADIAAVAYLLARGGDAAAIAAAVLAQTDPSALPSCADAAAAHALLAAARSAAGPYQVNVSAPAGQARPGRPVPVLARVRTNAGDPVQGVRVGFAADGARFATPSAMTDAAGVARDSVTVASGAIATVSVTATAAVSIGLREATITATRSATNPTGSSVPAVYAAPPVDYSGQATLAVDQTAHPVVSTALSTRLFRAGAPFKPRARISGLNGHAAAVDFDLVGPLPLKDRTLCAAVKSDDWSAGDVHVAGTSSVTVTGDGTAQGGALRPAAAGCYALRTTVATVDATPAVRRSAPMTVVAVLDTAVTGEDEQPAVFSASSSAAATLTGQLRMTDPHGLRGRVQVTLIGPIRPADGDCRPDASDWPRAPKHTVAATVRAVETSGRAVDRAGAYDYAVTAPNGAGCYLARPSVTLAAAGGGSLRIAASDARAAYVLDPTVTASVERTWAVSPAPVPVRVQVDGLYGLAAHVRTTMYLATAAPGGCGRADFAGAARVGTGPAAEVPAEAGTVTVAVQSGPTPRVGCYAVVPEITVDVDQHVRIAGTVGSPGSTLIAGKDPTRHTAPAARQADSGTSLEFVVAMGVLAALLLAVTARVVLVAWRDRDGPPDEPGNAGGDADPFDLTGGGLPSGT